MRARNQLHASLAQRTRTSSKPPPGRPRSFCAPFHLPADSGSTLRALDLVSASPRFSPSPVFMPIRVLRSLHLLGRESLGQRYSVQLSLPVLRRAPAGRWNMPPRRVFPIRPMGSPMGLSPAESDRNQPGSTDRIWTVSGLVTGESRQIFRRAVFIHTREVAGSKPAAPTGFLSHERAWLTTAI